MSNRAHETQRDRDRAEERAHGGIVSRSGDIATLGDGSQWWLNGSQWARDEADAAAFAARSVSRIHMRA